MYRRSKRGPGCMILVIIVGITLGVLYVVWDQASRSPSSSLVLLPSSTPLPLPTETAVYPVTLPAATSDASVLLVIPGVEIAVPVIQIFLGDSGSWNVTQLGYNAGHLNGTAWLGLGQPGNMVIAGHVEMADGKPGIFAHIDQLQAADEVLLILGGERWVYQVDGVEDVAPDDLRALYPTPSDRLTLLTCGDYDLISNTYRDRVIVTATRMA